MTYDVFISYAAENKAVADTICVILEDRKIRCWIAPRNILPGEDWMSALTRAVRSSQALVVVYSSHCNQSGHVLREINLAIQYNVVIIPFRIEDKPLSDSLEYLLGTTHWLDALTPPLEHHIERLSDLINALLQDPQTWRPATSPHGAPHSDWIVAANLKERFTKDGFRLHENLSTDGWPIRLLAERHKLEPSKLGFVYRIFGFSEASQVTLDKARALAVSCGDFAVNRLKNDKEISWISKSITNTILCVSVLVVESLSADVAADLTGSSPYSFKIANSAAYGYVIPAIYDTKTRRTFMPKKSPIMAFALWPGFLNSIEHKLMR
jgi:hypothetical protein